MKTEEIVEQLAPWLQRHQKSAWKPIVEEEDGPPDASKFCGTPWVDETAPWPACGNCQLPMQHFFQLNLDTVPEELKGQFGNGLLQLFYCTREECQGYGGWEPFGNNLNHVRVIHPAPDAISQTEIYEQEEIYPAKCIVGWTKFDELPATAEHDELGLEYIYDHKASTVKLVCKELQLELADINDPYLAENIANSELGDKLCGWPHWIQGVEYPNCAQCNQRMIMVFQVDSEDNVPFMFGDAGCGYLTQCTEHKDVVAFSWSCG